MFIHPTLHRLEDIKRLRKKYHLTQKELADHANVSQSLIAKLEAGMINPSYTLTMQIFQALEQIREKKEIKAGEIMSRKIVVAESTAAVKEIIKVMKSKGISQVPVMAKGNVVGLLSEGTILRKIAEAPEKIATLKAVEVMEEAPPIVPVSTGLKTILDLLRDYPIILVAEKGEVKGLISKTDVLGKVE